MAYDYVTALRLLNNESWSQLSVKQKISVLQSVEYNEAIKARRLPCNIVGKTIPNSSNGSTLGYFDTESKDIIINTNQLVPGSKYGDNYKEHLDTVLHEGRHAYQDQCINGLHLGEQQELVDKWNNDYKSYVEPNEENIEKYKEQLIEKDAEAYADYKKLGVEKDKLYMERNDLVNAKKQMLERDLSNYRQQKINLLEQKKSLLQQYSNAGENGDSDGHHSDISNKRAMISSQMNNNVENKESDGQSRTLNYDNNESKQEKAYTRSLHR